MKSQIEADENLDSGFARLIQSKEWETLSRMPEVTNRFNLFDVLEEAICENAWSSILAFLFDSTADHALGLAPLRRWIKNGLESRFLDLANSAKSSTCQREWGTFERRRLDILIKLLDEHGRLVGIIGIENKVWSGEQHNQLSDYQHALKAEFRDVPKILVFLTPDDREPTTFADLPECPVQRVSYASLVKMCDEMMPGVEGGVRLLFESLCDYIDRNLLGKAVMESKVKETVAKLYQDRENRRIIDLIVQRRPTVKAVLEKVAASIALQLNSGVLGPALEFSHDYWPEKDEFTPEMRLWPTSWEGETHRLQDLANIDVEGLSSVLSGTIRKTLEPLRKALQVDQF